MSIRAVNQFLRKVSQDRKIQQELIKVTEFNDNDRVVVTELGAKYGFDFTPDELWQEVEKLQNKFKYSQNDEQLSDEELESVGGGSHNWPTLKQLIGNILGERKA